MSQATLLTPYAASKIVNEVLTEVGVTKTLPPQMFYNYTKARLRAGKAPFIECDEDGRITEDALARWFVKYAKKNFNVDVTV